MADKIAGSEIRDAGQNCLSIGHPFGPNLLEYSKGFSWLFVACTSIGSIRSKTECVQEQSPGSLSVDSTSDIHVTVQLRSQTRAVTCPLASAQSLPRSLPCIQLGMG